MKVSFVVLSILVLACTTAGVAQSVIPVSSATGLVATADAEGKVTDASTMSELASVNSLFSSVSANATGGAGNSTGTANVFAVWNSFNPSQGVVTFSNVGWSITAAQNCTGNCGAYLGTGPVDYQYTFISASSLAQYFFVNCDVVASTPGTLGLHGSSLYFNSGWRTLGLGATGSDRFVLLPGDPYALHEEFGERFRFRAWSIQREMNAQLFFNTPRPEPSSLLLIGTGLVGLAGVLRLRLRL